MKPYYKLPSFQFGFMEVVSAAVYTVAASILVRMLLLLKRISIILKVKFLEIISGWTNHLESIFNTAYFKSLVIDRMVYEKVQLNNLFSIFKSKKLAFHIPTQSFLCSRFIIVH